MKRTILYPLLFALSTYLLCLSVLLLDQYFPLKGQGIFINSILAFVDIIWIVVTLSLAAAGTALVFLSIDAWTR